jgi:hypothetical protein
LLNVSFRLVDLSLSFLAACKWFQMGPRSDRKRKRRNTLIYFDFDFNFWFFQRSHLFHLIAWAIPAIQTISVLALGKVEGDVLSGVCFVGQLDKHSLFTFLLVPSCIYLSLGTLFLFAGFVSLFRIRTVMKNDGSRTDKLERLMMRIGFFSALFILPSFVYLGW